MLACISRAMRCRSPMFFTSLDLQDPIWPAERLERGAEHRIFRGGLRVRRCRGRLLHAPYAHRDAHELTEIAFELAPLAIPHLPRELVAEREDDRPALDRDRFSLHELRRL